jgi:putative transposase
VIWLLHRILQQHPIEGITLRNDNGSQFIAHAVRDYLKEQQVNQEFIHVACPQENSFIEAYHRGLAKNSGAKLNESFGLPNIPPEY